jgi:hypothetical protein
MILFCNIHIKHLEHRKSKLATWNKPGEKEVARVERKMRANSGSSLALSSQDLGRGERRWLVRLATGLVRRRPGAPTSTLVRRWPAGGGGAPGIYVVPKFLQPRRVACSQSA